ELRRGEHPSRPQLEEMGGQELKQTGYALAKVGAVAELFDIPERESITPLMAKRLASSLQSCGFGIEPDARYTGKACRWDEAAVLFTLPGGATPEGELPSEPSAAEMASYQSYAFLMRLAFHVMQAAGPVTPETAAHIANRIAEIFPPDTLKNAEERARFKAVTELAARGGVEAVSVRVPTQGIAFDKNAVRRLLVELVAQQGRIGDAQEKALALAWKRLGLDGKSLKGELDSLSSHGVIFFGGQAGSGRGEKIPPPPNTDVPFALNREALATLLADTRQVQAALNEAMAEDEEVGMPDEVAAEPEVVPVAVEEFPGLAPRFVPLLRSLLEQDEWPEVDAQKLARENSVMLSGAVEAINEWGFEKLDAQLIWEDGENLTVERALLK
ncbi:hypothetical protein EON80_14715, partial [bacterium]